MEGFPCTIHSHFELYKNRLDAFPCDDAHFFNDVFAAAFPKRVIIKTWLRKCI
jgi:hypothetical protein